MTYAEKLKDPRWQKKRLEVLERDEWMCQKCFDNESTLYIHHKYYEKGRDPWDYPMEAFLTLCESCHEQEHGPRLEYEKELLNLLRKKGFMADDISRITKGFSQLEIRHASEVTASLVEFVLSDSFTVNKCWDIFWNDLHEKVKGT